MTLTDQIHKTVEEKWISVDWMGNNIVVLDGEKEPWHNAVVRVDTHLTAMIGDVNKTLVDVANAYQDRIIVGCRTDLFWRVTDYTPASGGGGGGSPANYDLRCVRISPVGYSTSSNLISSGITTVVAVLQNSGSISSFSNPEVKVGLITDYWHGLKYFNEPVTEDIGDTTVGSFIGTVSTGSTVLTMMTPYVGGLQDLFTPNQLIITDQAYSLFASIQGNVIVGIGSTIADLSGVSTTGIGETVVGQLILKTPTVGFASVPPDGPLVTFTVLSPPVGIMTFGDYGKDFESNPFSPQTLGIITTGTLGIGTQIYYDVTGIASETQSWRPEFNTEGLGLEEWQDPYLMPSVGAGRTWYMEGFTNYPVTAPGGSTAASEGDTVNVEASQIANMYDSLSTCATQDAAIVAAENVRNTKESEFSSGISTFNTALAASNALRDKRNDYEQRIYVARQAIGAEIADVNKAQSLQSYVDAYPDVIGP